MYGIIKDGQLITAPRVVTIGNRVVSNPTDEQLIQLGYKPISYVEKPTDELLGQSYIETWSDNGNSIVQTWELQEVDLGTLKELKVKEMNDIQQSLINQGTEVEMSDGQMVRYTITNNDQNSLNSLSIQNLQGVQSLPWHPADESVHCKFYSEEEMKKITDTCSAFVTYHVTYFRDLRIYIRSLKTTEEVRSVTYGIEIPTEYQSEVLKYFLENYIIT